MPLQNRVTPFGEIVAVPERGTLMGNRGILHDAEGRIRRRWAGRAWIACLLEFRGRRDPVMAPGHYTRLFFLDEPTALAAGHRPCAYCRRPEYLAFRAAWASGNATLGLGPAPSAPELDRVLHAERLGPDRAKRLELVRVETLPAGAFVTLEEGSAYLLWQGVLWRWSPGGYAPSDAPVRGPARLLTPPSIVAALAAGYPLRAPA